MSGLWAWAEKQKPDFDALWAEAGSRTQCGPDDCSIRGAWDDLFQGYEAAVATIDAVVLELGESREQENRGFGGLVQMAIVRSEGCLGTKDNR